MMMMNRWRPLAAVCALTLFVMTGACGGGGDALGLKHRVSDKELAGLDTEATLRLESHKGDIAKLQDTFAMEGNQVKGLNANVESSGQQQEQAENAIEAASDKIEASKGAEEKDLDQARARQAQRQAELKQQYEQETRQIRERFAKVQEGNRAVLATAKGGKAVADAQQNLHKAELAEQKARQAARLQEVRAAKAKYEVSRLEEVVKLTGVVGPEQQARKVQFDGQLVEEEKKLSTAQAELAKREEATKLAQGRIEQEKARAQKQ